MFVSNLTGIPLQYEKLQLYQTFPKQLPKGVSAEDLANQALTSSTAMKGLVVVQIMAQVFLKGSMNDLWSLFFTMQLICYLKIYDTPVPSNAEIYMQEFLKIIEF